MTTSSESTTGEVETQDSDVLNRLAGITPDSSLGQLRAQRPEVLRYAQGSYKALFEPDDLGDVSLYERALIALRVATLTSTAALANQQREQLRQLGASDEAIAAIEQFPHGSGLSDRETALLQHTDRVAREPASSTKEHLDALYAVGLGPRDIVTISQLIAFLSFQVRALTGLRLLGEEV